MLELRTLGGLDLRREDGHEVASLLAQPKRAALLVYLATAGPGRFRARDDVVGLFWPDSPPDRARHALSQALYVIRGHLGADTVVRRGQNEVGVDASAVACDVLEFEAALAAGRREEALGLYGGDFLKGFRVGSARGFTRWMDDRRLELRRSAAEAAWGLAEASEARGEPFAAARWGRRAAGLTPLDESGHRRLMELLERLGDRGGALKVYEDLRSRLSAELDADPSPATRELAGEIRRRGDAGSPPLMAEGPSAEAGPDGVDAQAPGGERSEPTRAEPAPPAHGAEAGEPATADGAGSPETPGEEAAPSHDTPKRAARAAVTPGDAPKPDAERGVRGPPCLPAAGVGDPAARYGAVALAVGIAVLAAVVETPTGRAGETVSDHRYAVFPFLVHDPGDWAYLGEGMTDLMSAKLATAEGLSALDPRRLSRHPLARRQGEGEPILPGRAAESAREMGAGRFVLGHATVTGDEVALGARLYATREPDAPLAQVQLEGETDDLLDLTDRLAAAVLAAEVDEPEERMDRIAAVTTDSWAALRAFLRGEQAYRGTGAWSGDPAQDRFGEAIRHFRRAAELDSTFALASYRLALAAEWNQERPAVVDSAVDRALRHEDRLTPHYRTMVRGYRAYLTGDVETAERLFRGVLAARPHDVEALYGLGDALFHLNPLRGRSRREAAPVFRHLVRHDPTFRHALAHLMHFAAASHRWDRADSLARVLYGGRVLPHVRHLRDFAEGDSVDRDRAFRALEDAPPVMNLAAGVFAADYVGSVDVGRELVRRATRDSALSPEWRAEGRLMLGTLAMAAGRPEEAWAALETARGECCPAPATELAVLFGDLPFVSRPDDRDSIFRSRLQGMSAIESPRYPNFILRTRQHRAGPVVDAYLLGLLALRRGDGAAAESRIGELRSLARDAPDPGRIEGTSPPSPSTPADDARPTEEPEATGARAATPSLPPRVRVLAGDLALDLRSRRAERDGDLQRALALLERMELETPPRLTGSAFHGRLLQRFRRAELLRRLDHPEEALDWYRSIAPGDVWYEIAYQPVAHLRAARILDELGRREEALDAYRTFLRMWSDPAPHLRPEVEKVRTRVDELTSG